VCSEWAEIGSAAHRRGLQDRLGLGRAEAVRGLLREQAVDRVRQVRGRPGGWVVRLDDSGGDGRQRVAPLERRSSLDRRVERRAQRPEVRRRPAGLAAGSLRGQVRRRADEHAGGGERHVAVSGRDAEVGEHDPAVLGEHDVARLDVAVQDAGRVRGGERAQDRETDLGHHR